MWLQAEASRRGYAHTQGEQARATGRLGWVDGREEGSPRLQLIAGFN
jgi:hypothetical protein